MQRIFLTTKKIRAGVFHGPQIWQLIRDKHFIGTMTKLQNNLDFVFKNFVKGFFELHTQKIAPLNRNYPETFKELQNAWLQHEYQISFSAQLFDDFLEIIEIRDEQNEQFHQNLKFMEQWCHSRQDEHMMHYETFV